MKPNSSNASDSPSVSRGFSPFSQNMVQFNREWVPLTVLTILILLGNTCFPIAVYAVVAALRLLFRGSKALRLLETHPRFLYTHLFPFSATLILSLSVLASLASQV